MQKFMKTCWMALALCAFSAYCAQYHVKPGATDLSDPESYRIGTTSGDTATTLPGLEDDVVLPTNNTVSIDASSASFTTLSGVNRVRPNVNAVLEIMVADGDTKTFNAPINFNGHNVNWVNDSIGTPLGKIVKKGAGTLILGSSGKYVYNGYNQDYETAIDLQQGTLMLPQSATGDMYFGDLTMSAGTTLFTCNGSSSVVTYLRSLNGDGTITNAVASSSSRSFGPYGRATDSVSNEFRGRICHPARLWISGRLTQYGNSTGITKATIVFDNKGHVGDGYDLGTYSFQNVALLGEAGEVQYRGRGAGIHYFGGVDATISKEQQLYTYGYPTFVDAGWHGGLTFSLNWNMGAAANDSNGKVSKWLVLTGSNTVPCKISGKLVEKSFSEGAPQLPIFTQKLGSGTWRLSNSGDEHGGGFAIEEGTLQFDSIAEKGVPCSLGVSTNLTEACSVANPAHVDYAFSLGSTNASVPAATFEFTGGKSGTADGRSLVLVGKGGAIKASGTDGARVGFCGISARDAGETTLTLNGTSTSSNVASGITDGEGKVSVVKNGEGEWHLYGTNTFSGDLYVKAGTLTVHADSKYSWFRLTVKETAAAKDGNAEASEKSYLYLRQLALYDSNGVRQNVGLTVTMPTVAYSGTKYWPDSDYVGLTPGSFAFGASTFLVKYYTVISDQPGASNTYADKMFSEYSAGDACYLRLYDTGGNNTSITAGNRKTWIPFVMRLTNGTPEIVRYDVQAAGGSGATNYWPKIATMEASVDGIHWNLVETNALGAVVENHEYDFSIPLTCGSNRWFSDGTERVSGQVRPGAGFPIRGRADIPAPLQNVRSVSVDAGATLRTYDDVTISSLKVDSAGAGTIDGFTFAENGTFDVEAGEDLQRITVLPGSYVNCSGLANVARWSVRFNGTPSDKYIVGVRDGHITLTKRGFVIVYK